MTDTLRTSQLIPHVNSTLDSFQNALLSNNPASVEYLGNLSEMKTTLAVAIEQSLESGDVDRIAELFALHDQVSALLDSIDIGDDVKLEKEEELSEKDEDNFRISTNLPIVSEIDEDFNTTHEEFLCTICYDDTEPGDGFKFLDCGHKFCKECLDGYYTNRIESGEVNDIRCPQLECDNPVQVSDVWINF